MVLVKWRRSSRVFFLPFYFNFLADLCVDDGFSGLGTEGLEEISTGVGIT